MKKLIKLITVLALLFSLSAVYAQEEVNKRNTKSVGGVKVEEGNVPDLSFGKQIGRTKFKNFKLMQSEGNTQIIFDEGLVIELNHEAETFRRLKGKVIGSGDKGSMTYKGLPLKGAIVKGGRNPGPNALKIMSDAEGNYNLPANWTVGNYKIEINMEASGGKIFILDLNLDENGEFLILPTTNFKGAGSPKASGF